MVPARPGLMSSQNRLPVNCGEFGIYEKEYPRIRKKKDLNAVVYSVLIKRFIFLR